MQVEIALSAVNLPAAMDSCVAAFMASISKRTSAIKFRESNYLRNGLVNATPRELTMTARAAHAHYLVARALCTGDSQDKAPALPAASVSEELLL